MSPAHVDLRAPRGAANLQHEGLHVLADAVVLKRRLFGRSQDRLGFAHVQDDGSRLDAGDRAGDELAFAAGVLVEDDIALGLVQPLQDDLLGRLGVDSAEGLLIELFRLDKIAQLRTRLEGLGVDHADLSRRILDLLGHETRPEDADLAGVGIDSDVDVLVAGGTLIRGLNGLLDGPNQLLPRDPLLSVELQEGADEIPTHFAPPVSPATQQKTWGSPTSRAASRFPRVYTAPLDHPRAPRRWQSRLVVHAAPEPPTSQRLRGVVSAARSPTGAAIHARAAPPPSTLGRRAPAARTWPRRRCIYPSHPGSRTGCSGSWRRSRR